MTRLVVGVGVGSVAATGAEATVLPDPLATPSGSTAAMTARQVSRRAGDRRVMGAVPRRVGGARTC